MAASTNRPESRKKLLKNFEIVHYVICKIDSGEKYGLARYSETVFRTAERAMELIGSFHISLKCKTEKDQRATLLEDSISPADGRQEGLPRVIDRERFCFGVVKISRPFFVPVSNRQYWVYTFAYKH